MLEVFSIEVKLAKSSEFVGSLVSISYYIHMISALLAGWLAISSMDKSRELSFSRAVVYL